MLEELKQHRKTVGLKQSLRAVEADKVLAVYIADDAEERVVKKIVELCKAKNIEIRKAESMKVLGRTCGIDVGTAVAAILKE
ncbi:MAG: 50S ribosomal protein L7ae-like protein [Clostridiaceae bacterium]|nr:50S ribosomal protein L7ae-like protein [Clostridiaceae bacterium]